MDTRRRISFNMNSGGGSSTPDNPGTGGGTFGPINTSNYMTILALEGGLTAKLSSNACQYCIDGDGNWIDLPAGTTTQSINSGQTLSFKGNLKPTSSKGIGRFTISKKCNIEGNCMSMLFGDEAAENDSLSGKNYAFRYLFSGCTTIVQVSETFLPATTLAEYCYSYMFYNCSSLTTAPELPVTTLASWCYESMFNGCTRLTTAPELPATTLASSCYTSMFRGCSSLTTAPELPVTTLASSCYTSMFWGCSGLTTAPELPATTLASSCYTSMFWGCSGLTTAPVLPATTLANYCYSNMFNGCSNLNYIKMLATNISASGCLSSWVYNVSSTGTFVKNPAMTSLPTGTSGIPSGWTVVDDTSINTSNYMTILALEDGLTASLSNACQYCIDGNGNWIDLPSGTTTQAISSGQTLSFKGELTPKSSKGIGTFTISKKCNLEGNCMSMLFGDEAAENDSLSGKNYAFRNLFSGCTTIIQVSETFLPATTLASYCYSHMFNRCSGLTTAPELPATTLASYCYQYMFDGCSGLTTAPSILPATTLAEYCYTSMFRGCTSLTVAPELPATTLASDCYSNMFWGCSGLTTAPELPATTLASYCYSNMFTNCTSLTTPPELPATTLASYCYSHMFPGCSGLTTAPVLPATTLAEYCYSHMFYSCSRLTTAPKLPATTLSNECYSSMFYGCSSLTTAPALPATTLAYSCYSSMFRGCRKLNYIKMLATDISASFCLTNWVSNVSSTGTFVKNPAMTSLPTGTSGIPSGWTVVDDN